MNTKESEEFLLKWNYHFPADKWWRRKYNIPLFSQQHLEASQINIALEYKEEELYNRLVEEKTTNKKREDLYRKGEWLIPDSSVTTELEEDLFSKLDISKLNK